MTENPIVGTLSIGDLIKENYIDIPNHDIDLTMTWGVKHYNKIDNTLKAC